MLEMKALAEATAMIVKAHVAEAVTPLLQRIDALEKRPTEPDSVVILQIVQDEIAKIPPPENGKDADPEQVASLVAEEVERAVAALPAPQDGKSVGVEDVAPMIAEEVAKAVAEIPVPKDGNDGTDGKDGRGVKELLIDRDGQLVATMDDGELKTLGPVIGKDGERGKDGRDGLGFDDMDVAVLDDDRTIELSFRRGDEEKAFTLKWPTVIDRGVFKADRDDPYEPGDGVTWGGQFYIANEQTNEKPDFSKDGKPWRLAVRKGRDGKDAKNG